MRTTMLTGGVLVVAAVAIVMLSSTLGLEVESVALMGAATGAVIALVPDRTPQARLIGFLVGFGASWLAYLVRAGFLPDTHAGHALAVGLVVIVCTLVAGLSRDRVPLWATLVGAAALTGSYETTYVEAPSQVLSTSASSSTSVLLAVALGFFAAALVAPGRRADGEDLAAPAPEPTPDATGDETSLGVIMKEDAR
ncbi:MAG TPA: hypothetical protein VFI40_15370 [Nocardioides sp.]|nr:hypothetical protein [Nocardioides sp.]